jgi:hypothetical protein
MKASAESKNASDTAPKEPITIRQVSGSSVAKFRHARELATSFVAALPLAGALATAAWWMIGNYYVGTVEIKPDHDFQTIIVHVFDLKGSEHEFHSVKFQLAPGEYELVVSLDEKPVHRYRANVSFNSTTAVPVTVDTNKDLLSNLEEPPRLRKKWWQFWKR